MNLDNINLETEREKQAYVEFLGQCASGILAGLSQPQFDVTQGHLNLSYEDLAHQAAKNADALLLEFRNRMQ